MAGGLLYFVRCRAAYSSRMKSEGLIIGHVVGIARLGRMPEKAVETVTRSR
jgi:hypothetical protein